MPIKHRMTIKSITDIDYERLNKLNVNELRNILDDAIFYANQRTIRTSISYAKKPENYPVPLAYGEGSSHRLIKGSSEKSIRQQGAIKYRAELQKLSNIKGEKQELNQLRHMFMSYRNFLDTKTSTVAGAEENIRNIIDKISKYTGVKIRRTDYEKFWKTVNNLSYSYMTDSNNYEIYRKVFETMNMKDYKDYSPDDLAAEMEKRYDNLLTYGNEEGIYDENYVADEPDLFPLKPPEDI